MYSEGKFFSEWTKAFLTSWLFHLFIYAKKILYDYLRSSSVSSVEIPHSGVLAPCLPQEQREWDVNG